MSREIGQVRQLKNASLSVFFLFIVITFTSLFISSSFFFPYDISKEWLVNFDAQSTLSKWKPFQSKIQRKLCTA